MPHGAMFGVFALIFILPLRLLGAITNTKQGILETVDVLSKRSQRGEKQKQKQLLLLCWDRICFVFK